MLLFRNPSYLSPAWARSMRPISIRRSVSIARNVHHSNALWLSPSELGQALAARRERHEFFQPLESRLFFLRADDAPADGLSIRSGLRVERIPGGFVRLQAPLVRLDQIHAALFVGVNARLVFLPGLIRLQTGRLHQPLLDQRFGPLDVDA